MPAIIAQGLGKRFQRFHADRPRTLMEATLSGWRRLRPRDRFWALREISFTVWPGQMLGIIGHNGAGKSTLLQILGKVLTPDEGSLQIHGRIGALLDLGASFHPDLTGRENVYISGIVAGLTRREVSRCFEAIVAFAELAEFIDSPLRTYSTGMQMRLAFSIAIHTEPDVLLVDEFLSVGDLAFQAKCLSRIQQLRSNGCAIVLISQNAKQVQELCDQAMWLRQGQIVAYGHPEEVAGQYASQMESKTQSSQPKQYSRDIEIQTVRLLNDRDLSTADISSGDGLTIEIEYISHQALENVIFSVSICQAEGQIYLNTHSASAGLEIPIAIGQNSIRLYLERLDLSGGNYFVNAGVFSPDWSQVYDYHWQLYPLQIRWTPQENSILYPPRRWELRDPARLTQVDRY